MIEIGRVCIKTAGRDAGKKCVIVDILDNHAILIDGETRRRKVNQRHVEPTTQTVTISKGAHHAAVAQALNTQERKPSTKQTTARPRKTKKQKTRTTTEKATPPTKEITPAKKALPKQQKTPHAAAKTTA